MRSLLICAVASFQHQNAMINWLAAAAEQEFERVRVLTFVTTSKLESFRFVFVSERSMAMLKIYVVGQAYKKFISLCTS